MFFKIDVLKKFVINIFFIEHFWWLLIEGSVVLAVYLYMSKNGSECMFNKT